MSGGVQNMATVLKRLEAVTSRLEDLYENTGGKATATASGAGAVASAPHAATNAPPPPPPAPAVNLQPADEPPSVVAYDEDIIQGKVKPWVQLTESFAIPSVVEQAKTVEQLFTNLGGLVRIAALCKKPDQNGFAGLLLDIQKDIEATTQLKESNRKERDWFNHLSMVAEGVSCAGWVTVENKPGPYVSDVKDSTQFYANRVIKEFKEKDPKHVEWVHGYIAILDTLKAYIMAHHTTGLVWNPKGISLDEYKSTAKPAAPAGGAPPPPPPPPPPPAAAPPPSAAPAAGGVEAVFAQLNQGEAVTKGLRKVDKSEMTHKNPALRAGGVVPEKPGSHAAAPKKPVKPTKPSALAGKKPAKFALEGNKWIIEYQENEPALTVEGGEISQTVNLFGCKNTTVIVKGKVNAVTLVNCTKTSVLVESVIASISVTKSPSFTLQITGNAPTIQLDSTDSGQIYLSKDCLGVEITTAKCSSINVSLPVEGEEEGVFEEQAIPEMFKTTVKDDKLVTTVIDHVG